jgi:hypothetical protein
MTTTSRRKPTKPSVQKIELAPNQIYLLRAERQKRPIQTLVEGSEDWSYETWEYSDSISLYYRGWYITNLKPNPEGVWVDARLKDPSSLWTLPTPCHYVSIVEAIRHYASMPEQLTMFDRLNRKEGLELWCIRKSFTPMPLSLILPLSPQERKRIERLADYEGLSVDHFFLKALYAALPEIEERYNDYCKHYPEDCACEVEEGAK